MKNAVYLEEVEVLSLAECDYDTLLDEIQQETAENEAIHWGLNPSEICIADSTCLNGFH